MSSDWNIQMAMFGHYRLARKTDKEYVLGIDKAASGIFFRASEVDELLDILEEFKAKQNSGN